jgi:hypothetical protein
MPTLDIQYEAIQTDEPGVMKVLSLLPSSLPRPSKSFLSKLVTSWACPQNNLVLHQQLQRQPQQ